MLKTPIRFIVIDDDEINNFYCSIIIEESAGTVQFQTISVPEKEFEYITKEYSDTENPLILFPDIYRPASSGWHFSHNFEKLDQNIKRQIKIYILSSSVDPAQRQSAEDKKYVAGYIEKPLSELNVLSILTPHRSLKQIGS